MDINAIVINYNTSIADSLTLKTLLDTCIEGINLHISVWNNGPSFFQEDDISEYIKVCQAKGISLEVYQDPRNMSLSVIYNYFTAQKGYDFVTILDQDSRLNPDFFMNIVAHKEFDLIVPNILAHPTDKTHRYPYRVINDRPAGPPASGNVTGPIRSIASGMTLSAHLIKTVITFRGYVFEPRLAFYGIDMDFFNTINKINETEQRLQVCCVGEIIHSLSADDKKESVSQFRILETFYYTIFNRRVTRQKSEAGTYWILLREVLRGKLKPQSIGSAFSFVRENIHPRSKMVLDKDISPTHRS